jgi:cytochrome c556
MACALLGSMAVSADKAKTAEDLQKSMKTLGPAQTATNKAIQAMAYADAKKQVAVMKSEISDAANFWVIKKKDDAVKFSQETIAKLDALDKALDRKDQTAITSAYRDAGAACSSCHRVYRSTDENNQFIIKPGSVS